VVGEDLPLSWLGHLGRRCSCHAMQTGHANNRRLNLSPRKRRTNPGRAGSIGRRRRQPRLLEPETLVPIGPAPGGDERLGPAGEAERRLDAEVERDKDLLSMLGLPRAGDTDLGEQGVVGKISTRGPRMGATIREGDTRLAFSTISTPRGVRGKGFSGVTAIK
jgi:hypothetical protein